MSPIAEVPPVLRVLGSLLDPPADLAVERLRDGAGTTGCAEQSKQAEHEGFVSGKAQTFTGGAG